ncbi:cobalt ABC transporter substrate-binding protein CbiN, partial [Klebsiella pneumoniae]
MAPDYQPWFQPLYEPASGEIESLLGRRSGEARSRWLAPDYQPWFQPLYEPASGEIESLL